VHAAMAGCVPLPAHGHKVTARAVAQHPGGSEPRALRALGSRTAWLLAGQRLISPTYRPLTKGDPMNAMRRRVLVSAIGSLTIGNLIRPSWAQAPDSAICYSADDKPIGILVVNGTDRPVTGLLLDGNSRAVVLEISPGSKSGNRAEKYGPALDRAPLMAAARNGSGDYYTMSIAGSDIYGGRPPLFLTHSLMQTEDPMRVFESSEPAFRSTDEPQLFG